MTLDAINQIELEINGDLIDTWAPRPDDPARFDQQESFYNSRHPGVTFLVGGNGAGTTETCMAKVAKFLLTEQEAPRPDTPFWIIAGSYEQCMEACWKEKLNPRGGHGHIPECEVEWGGIRWYKTREGWPFRVPLKPWPNGKRPNANWVLEFKSYKQGRQQMQARSIGGFAFVEQFPWDILTEVVRGRREYDFPGAMLAEFTPIDPELSYNLQEMLEEDRLPPGWAVYRANTECALEAGHVTQVWFDQFFGMIPEEMRHTRLTGAWATFEGLIYQAFNPLVHFVDDDFVFPSGNFPRGVWHRRGIDWGSGPENPFACLFKYHNSAGEHVFYDEYYSSEPVTVGTHLKNVYDMWPWPENDPYYGMSYADPSDPGNIRLAATLGREYPGYGNISIQSASNRVLEGINHVRYLLQTNEATGRPRVFIHKKRCPNLAREIQIYRWLRGSVNSINPKSPRAEPLKKDDHACFAADQVVNVPGGTMPITSIREGQLVLTHLGSARAMSNCEITGYRKIFRIILNDGREIKCTEDHPIKCANGMWTKAIQCEDMLVLLEKEAIPKAEMSLRLSNMAAFNGGDIPIRRTIQSDHILGDLPDAENSENSSIFGCISRSTKTALAQFAKGKPFTTKMAMPGTILQKIWSFSVRQIMPSCILKISERLPIKQKNGMPHQLEENGTQSMLSTSRRGGAAELCPAHSAARCLSQKIPVQELASVPQDVGIIRGRKNASIMNSGLASSVGTNFGWIDTLRLAPVRNPVAPVNVGSIEELGVEPVYNFATEHGTYFVNGILVSNCDAMRYALFSEANQTGTTVEHVKRPGAQARRTIRHRGK